MENGGKKPVYEAVNDDAWLKGDFIKVRSSLALRERNITREEGREREGGRGGGREGGREGGGKREKEREREREGRREGGIRHIYNVKHMFWHYYNVATYRCVTFTMYMTSPLLLCYRPSSREVQL